MPSLIFCHSVWPPTFEIRRCRGTVYHFSSRRPAPEVLRPERFRPRLPRRDRPVLHAPPAPARPFRHRAIVIAVRVPVKPARSPVAAIRHDFANSPILPIVAVGGDLRAWIAASPARLEPPFAAAPGAVEVRARQSARPPLQKSVYCPQRHRSGPGRKGRRC